MKPPTQMTKSPRAVAREALRLAQESLPPYSAVRSRKDYTQHQLFAILALKAFLKVDYRAVEAFLKDFAELRDDLGLKNVPHYSTLNYAEQRLLKKGRSSYSSSAPPRPQPSAA
jgi:hypothetical protein